MTQTLMEMAGLDLSPGRLATSTLVLIDMQGEYERALALPDVEASTAQAAILLERARALGTPVIHVRHVGAAGSLFDPEGPGGAFLAPVAPCAGEAVVSKTAPSGFHETGLQAELEKAGRNSVIFIGFMTHMCVGTTVRRAA